MSRYNVIGVMSGTSLDGLDICYCSFEKSENWKFNIIQAETINLPTQLKEKLKIAIEFNGLELSFLNNEFGNFIGNAINVFIKKNQLNQIDFISSHGHTIFHQPDKNLTLQIGNGASISAITNLPVICDFRTTDIALNGNGAPLVPVGDRLLFSKYDYCINLGGIANVSFEENNDRIAFDICPTNIVLNHLSNRKNLDFDKNGELAQSGNLDTILLENLNNLEYYKLSAPKSLGYEWVFENIFPLLDGEVNDLLNTFTEHIAFQISKHLSDKKSVLFTGGGTYNNYLIERIKFFSNCDIIIPERKIIDFKEALIFGFLGVLRWRNEGNILKSVTGSTKNSIGGCIYNPLAI